MKNKLLVSVFAVGIAALALTSCETKSNVTEVCTDLVKATLHGNAAASGDNPNTARGLVTLTGTTLTIAEYEFPSKDVNDPRLLFRTISFGDGVYEPKKVDTMTYEYGDWMDQNTVFTLLVTPTGGAPYELYYRGDALIAPDGKVYGGNSIDNNARVEKMEKVVTSFPNTDWEADFRGEFVLDSVFRDSIRTRFIPPMTYITDTIQIFDHMDTVSADTTCHFYLAFDRNSTNLNTGHLFRKSVRSTYDRETKQATIVNQDSIEFDFKWYFSSISSDSKFVVVIKNTEQEEEPEELSISKFKLDDAGVPATFVLGGLTYKRPVVQP